MATLLRQARLDMTAPWACNAASASACRSPVRLCRFAGNFSVISAPRFELATRHSAALGELIFGYIETLWTEAQQNAVCNAIHDGSSRLCRWLLQCADRVSSEQLLLTRKSFSRKCSGSGARR